MKSILFLIPFLIALIVILVYRFIVAKYDFVKIRQILDLVDYHDFFDQKTCEEKKRQMESFSRDRLPFYVIIYMDETIQRLDCSIKIYKEINGE